MSIWQVPRDMAFFFAVCYNDDSIFKSHFVKREDHNEEEHHTI